MKSRKGKGEHKCVEERATEELQKKIIKRNKWQHQREGCLPDVLTKFLKVYGTSIHGNPKRKR